MGQMEISLSEAIEIHAHVLVSRMGLHAPVDAERHAFACRERHDEEGFEVWTRVKDTAAALLHTDHGLDSDLTN